MSISPFSCNESNWLLVSSGALITDYNQSLIEHFRPRSFEYGWYLTEYHGQNEKTYSWKIKHKIVCCLFNGLTTVAFIEYPFSPLFQYIFDMFQKHCAPHPWQNLYYAYRILIVHISWRKNMISLRDRVTR